MTDQPEPAPEPIDLPADADLGLYIMFLGLL